MTPEPRHSPIVPSYGAATLADLSSSILASLDPEAPESQNVLGLTPARRACLLVVDGLGWELLRDHPAVAPFLSELARNSKPIMAGFPSTTVTSLGSICTGRPPGQHGMLGYQVIIPGENRLLNGLRWDSRIDPRQWQPLPTIYERAVAAGIAAVHVAQGAFRGTGLTVATMRGADFRPADSMGALAAQAAAALWENGRGFVTVYHGDLDNTGHVFGVGSDAWYNQLAHVDKLAEQLASALPSGTCMYVTADHGMVDIGPEDKFDVDATPELRSGLALLGGEPRARHLYARRGAADGKTAWFYVPDDRQARKMAAKKLEDVRSPLAFLLGKAKLEKELRDLFLAPDVTPLATGDTVLRGAFRRGWRVRSARLCSRSHPSTEFRASSSRKSMVQPPSTGLTARRRMCRSRTSSLSFILPPEPRRWRI